MQSLRFFCHVCQINKQNKRKSAIKFCTVLSSARYCVIQGTVL